MAQDILTLSKIKKVYPNGIAANKDVDFSVAAGEIHALMGENGAGKSTLMKIAFGIEQPDGGEIFLNQKKVEIKSSNAAIQLGIGMVHQHFMLVPSLTVAENMILGIEPRRGGCLLDHKRAEVLTREIGEKYNLLVNPSAVVADLPVGMMQRVEILKALIRGAKILILDEPTAVLTPQETEELFRQLNLLKENGHTIIFISHKLKEIKAICDRITIMRAGCSMGVYQVSDVSEEDISRLMVGRDVVTKIQKEPSQPGQPVLDVKNVSFTNEIRKQTVKNVSFQVREGEIVGIAGVEGNGQRELIDMVAGFSTPTTGEISICGKNTRGKSIRAVRALGAAHIPEDRMKYGAATEGTIEENLISVEAFSPALNRGFMLHMKAVHALSARLAKDYNIVCDSPQQQVQMLSGGNIQKVVVAREMDSGAKLIIADQPIRGIDVGASSFIHQKLLDLRNAGHAILLSSADLNEVMELSDRLIVMYGGEIVAFFEDASQVDEKELGLYMLGLKTMEKVGCAVNE